MTTRELVRDGSRISDRTEGRSGPNPSNPARINGVMLDVLASVAGGRSVA